MKKISLLAALITVLFSISANKILAATPNGREVSIPEVSDGCEPMAGPPECDVILYGDANDDGL